MTTSIDEEGPEAPSDPCPSDPRERRVCFYGNEIEGSWKIRAEQLGRAMNGTSAAKLTPSLILEHDVFCVVKRLDRRKQEFLRSLGKLVVFDVLDCWKQPDDELRLADLAQIRRHFRKFFRGLPVDGVVFPNRTMMEDLGDLVPNPTVLYHHFRPGLEPIEIKRHARVVGYEGKPNYLGPWRQEVERACAERGLTFAVNPANFGDIDIGLAVRGGVHAGLLSTRYKSNVKLANFYGAGVPCVVGAERSLQETATEHVRFFTSAVELRAALDALLPYEARRAAQESFLRAREAFRIERIASDYRRYFERLRRAAS